MQATSCDYDDNLQCQLSHISSLLGSFNLVEK